MRRWGAAALDMAYVAAGRLDGYWERGINAWDMAAGVVIVREAGGFVQAIAKDGNMLEDGEVICANERIFETFSDTIRNG